MDRSEDAHLRIGELSQRTGVSPELLRAWERRYGLLRPARSEGGFRLYSSADEARVRRMRAHLGRGVAAAEAARLADRVDNESAPAGGRDAIASDLRRALAAFDEAGAQRVLDTALASFSLDTVISEVLIPYLEELGDGWASGDVTVAQEHFASNLIRSRLLSLVRSWDAGFGPRALLACPEGELHDLGIVLFGVALARRGWRITFLGANTPLPTIAETARPMRPDAVVIGITDPGHVRDADDDLIALSQEHRVVLGGAGAGAVAERLGIELLDGDPVTAAERLATPAF